MPLKTISLREIDLYYQKDSVPSAYAVLEKANIIKKNSANTYRKINFFSNSSSCVLEWSRV